MSKEFQLDYIDVATRIVDFRTKHPEGSLQQVDIKFIDFADKSWVVFTAAAYRTADDTRPGIGTAWEPVPGATNFTRGSEVQNAETAAWGRAIVAALAGDTKRGIASAEEVRNRTAERVNPLPPSERQDPLVGARMAVKAAWESGHDTFSPDEVAADFELWSSSSFAEATTDELLAYARHLAPPDAFETPFSPIATDKQVQVLSIALSKAGLGEHEAALNWLEQVVGRRMESRKELSDNEIKTAITAAKALKPVPA